MISCLRGSNWCYSQVKKEWQLEQKKNKYESSSRTGSGSRFPSSLFSTHVEIKSSWKGVINAVNCLNLTPLNAAAHDLSQAAVYRVPFWPCSYSTLS